MTQLISRRAQHISPLFRTPSARAAAILLLLAAALLLGSPAPQAQAQAQTEVWSATLTAREVGHQRIRLRKQCSYRTLQ